MGPRCLPAPQDAGTACIGQYQSCQDDPNGCCDGLSCQDTMMGQRCMSIPPVNDAGTQCEPAWSPCDDASVCCDGLVCKEIGGFVSLCQQP